MEYPPIFDEFFHEISIWFLIFMVTAFLIGFFTGLWTGSWVIRNLQRQLRRIRDELVPHKNESGQKSAEEAEK